MKSIVEEGSSVFKAIEKGWTRAGQPTHFSVKIFELPERNFFGMTTKQAKVGITFEHDTDFKNQRSSSAGQKRSNNKPAAHPAPAKKHVQADRTQSNDRTDRNAAPERAERHERSADRVERVDHVERPERQERPSNRPARQTHQREQRPDNRKERDQKERPRDAHQKEKDLLEAQPTLFVDKVVEAAAPAEQAPQPSTWSDDLVGIMQTLIRESLTMLGLPNIEFTHAIEQGVLKVTFDSPVIDNPVKEKQFFQHYAFLLIALLRNQSKVNFRSLRLFLASERGSSESV